MDNLTENIIVAIIGLILGYISSLFLAKFNARMALQRELKNSVSEKKSIFYIELWSLCDHNLDDEVSAKTRYEALLNWYNAGGGLVLSFKATNHFFSALNILENDFMLSQTELKNHLTWLRTEMKFEVGSYTRKEANTVLPSTNKVR